MKRWQITLGIGLILLGAWALLLSRLQAPGYPYGKGWGGGPGRPFASNGEQIYYTGISQRTGPIPFRGGPMWLSMHGGGCASCHGEQGQGGVAVMMLGEIPPNITYAHLTKPHHHEGGEESEPPYTDDLIKRAITKGVDSGGESLDPGMPRWQMFENDLDDLLAYLKTLSPAQ